MSYCSLNRSQRILRDTAMHKLIFDLFYMPFIVFFFVVVVVAFCFFVSFFQFIVGISYCDIFLTTL